jgi:hypothetical protein
MNSHSRGPFEDLAAAQCALAVNRVEFQLACMPGKKLTALCYGSVSAIGNRVTDVTCERSAGTRQRQQGEKVQQKSQQMS